MRLRHLVFLLLLPGVAGAAPGVPDDLMRLPEADVVILGEVHDNPLHHIHQARAVAALRPAAVVYEMLTPAQAAAGAGIDMEDRAALAEAFGWSASGWPDFEMYHPILLAARDAAVVGGGLEREAVRRAMREGAAAVIGADAARFGLDLPLDPGDRSEER